MPEHGFTIVLVDAAWDGESSDAGDYVHVESFARASDLDTWAMPGSWARRVAVAAHAIEDRDREHERLATALPATPDAEGRDARFTRTDDGHEDPRDLE